MKTRIGVALFFILFQFLILSAQKTLGLQNQIKLSISKFVDPVNSGIELSYERRFSDRFSTQLTGAYLCNINKIPPFENYTGVKFEIEEKWYYRNRGPLRLYSSADIIWNIISYNTVETFAHDEPVGTFPSRNYYEDSIGVQKRTYSLNFKFGFLIFIKQFVLDASLGIGVKYRDVKHSGRLDSSDELYGGIEPNVLYYTNLSGNTFNLNIPLSVKIGWNF